MSQLTRFTPQNLSKLFDNMSRSFLDDSWFNEMPLEPRLPNNVSLMPRCHHSETDGQHVYSFDMPGLTKDDVKLTVNKENRTLKVSGERKSEVEDNDNGHYKEVSYGSFSRKFTLAENTNVNECDATFSNGVLRVTFDKAETPVKNAYNITIN